MTNPIGANTCNLSINIPRDARSVLGRLAFKTDRSLGNLVRELLAKGLNDLYPECAGDWNRAVGKLACGAACLLAGLLVVASTFLNHGPEARRVRGRMARVRVIRVQEMEAA